MRDGGRIAAAIETLQELETHRLPAHLALRRWGERARYAGAKDRAFVSGLVLDSLRKRRSAAWRMADESPRATVLGVLGFVWDWPFARVEAAAGGEHGPGALTHSEQAQLTDPASLSDAPAPVRGDYADWMDASLGRAFGGHRAEEGAALAGRAPVDVRVNTLKADVSRVQKGLAAFAPERLPLPPNALRIAAPAAAERAATVEASPAFQRGWFEVQDAGSQVATAAAGDVRRQQVLDFCAGAGGKTLALAAAMENTGQLYAYDADARRLAETVRRAQRAGVRNLQVRSPTQGNPLQDLGRRMDLVFVDAPCTGSGTWRRHPDAKWRLSPQQLARRASEQDSILEAAAAFVKPGGRLIYATCSVFPEENDDRIEAFLALREGAFTSAPVAAPGAECWTGADGRLRLTPLTTETDGFFVAELRRKDPA